MKLKLLWLALLLPFTANAQWVNGVIQRNASSTFIQYLQGANAVRLATYSDLPTVTPVSFTAFGSTPNANGASVTSNVITLQPADGTNGGGLSTTAQTIAGDKTFIGDINLYRSAFGTAHYLKVGTTATADWSLGQDASSTDFVIKNATGPANAMVINKSTNQVAMSFLTNGLVGSTSGAIGNITVLPSGTTATTQTAGNNTTLVATTAFVTAAVSGVTGPWTVSSNVISPTVANDRVSVSSNSGSPTITGVATGVSVGIAARSTSSGAAFDADASGSGAGGAFRNNTTSNPTVISHNINTSGKVFSGLSGVGGTETSYITASGVFNGTSLSLSSSLTATGITTVGGYGSGSQVSLSIRGNSNAQVGSFDHDGQIKFPFLNSGTGTGLVVDASGFIIKNTSSIRYKKNVNPIDIGLDFIMGLKPVKYDTKNDNTAQVGFIAEDFPDERLVGFAYDSNKKLIRESINYAQITAPLVKAFQEAMTIIEKLEARIKVLEIK